MGLTELVLVRHGESEGNLARKFAESRGEEAIDLEWRDADTPLSERGRAQAQALGGWVAELPRERRPVEIWSSPYVRAYETARIAAEVANLQLPVSVDERLRDRELGVLDLLTGAGVRARYPDEAARRRSLGKLYYRPPGGESWTDVALRLRSYLGDLDSGTEHSGPILVASHDVVILMFRFVLESLDERTLLDVAAEGSVGNASVTRLVRDVAEGRWSVAEFGTVGHLHQRGVEA